MESKSILSKDNRKIQLGQVPNNLLFDDEPLESLVSGARNNGATPVNVLDLWQTGEEENEDCIEAVVSVLANDPELIDNIDDLDRCEKLLQKALNTFETEGDVNKAAELQVSQSRLLHVSGRLADAESICRRAVEFFHAEKGPADKKTQQALMYLARILDEKGESDEAVKIRRGCEIERFLFQKNRNGILEYREMALNLYLNGKPHEAEYIYKRLAAADFELPGTLCHLVRVYFMLDREIAEIRRVVANAWEKRRNASSYVIPRIIFLQLLLEFLENGETGQYIGRMKTALSVPGATMDWIINPVLDHVRHQLAPQYYYFMVALGKALCLRNKIPDLEQFPLWKEKSTKTF